MSDVKAIREKLTALWSEAEHAAFERGRHAGKHPHEPMPQSQEQVGFRKEFLRQIDELLLLVKPKPLGTIWSYTVGSMDGYHTRYFPTKEAAESHARKYGNCQLRYEYTEHEVPSEPAALMLWVMARLLNEKERR